MERRARTERRTLERWPIRIEPSLLAVRARALRYRIQNSLFFLPALFVLGAFFLAEALLRLDTVVNQNQLPSFLRTTVADSQSVLTAIAEATMTVAGLIFSLVFVAFQLASTNYSPRVLRTLVRSRFQQGVMGFMVGTFTYCLIVLRAIHVALGEHGQPVVPGIAVAGAVLLAILSVLAILAYVDSIGRELQVDEMIRRVTDQTLSTIVELRRRAREAELKRLGGDDAPEVPDEPGFTVCAPRHGWVQQIDQHTLLLASPPHSLIRLETRVGEYISEAMPLCTIWPPPQDGRRFERLAYLAVQIGRERTPQEDVDFGLRQLADIAVRALSPAVNAPTTAYEVVVHLGTILRELLTGDPFPRAIVSKNGSVLLRPRDLAPEEYIGHAFDQIRVFAASQQAVVIILLQTYGLLLREAKHMDSAPAIETLQEEAHLTLQAYKTAAPLPADYRRVVAVAREAGFGLEGTV